LPQAHRDYDALRSDRQDQRTDARAPFHALVEFGGDDQRSVGPYSGPAEQVARP
jgi:hypothetical protein